MGNDLRGFWKEDSHKPKLKQVWPKQTAKNKSKKKRKSRKPGSIRHREFALNYFHRKPEATDNILLAILICQKTGWDQCESIEQVRAVLRKFAKLNQKPKRTDFVKKKDADFYNSKAWKTLRYQALVNCGGACQCCGATASDGVKIHVDHIYPRSKHPKLELDLDNLQVACSDCNIGKDNWDDTNWRQHWESL
jgi:5-methylcytosine-specific restriction endonuclease McrA